jgi:hypothetical protein
MMKYILSAYHMLESSLVAYKAGHLGYPKFLGRVFWVLRNLDF